MDDSEKQFTAYVEVVPHNLKYSSLIEYKDKVNDNYTEANWIILQDALGEALLVIEKEDATQLEVDNASQVLKRCCRSP